MNICGRSFRDHIRLLSPLFALSAVVWALRWGLDAAGLPLSVVRMFSVTGATSLAILIAVWLIHTRDFGSYPNVVFAAFLLVAFEQMLIIAAIVFSVLSGIGNVFTQPEFSRPNDPSHVKHILGQLTFGIGAGMLFGAATGCLVLWLLRMLVPKRNAVSG
ncbi:MAG TPA: hypothetical protein VKF81_15260 [Blastocatellia bacterium]|nr:hypothetical protein [Blastocatellia bacterium]